MTSELTAMITLVSTSGVLTLFLCLYAVWMRKEMPGSGAFIPYMIALVIYIFAYAFQLASDTLEAIMQWTVVQYLGIATAPALGLIFILHYLGIRLSHGVKAAMLAIPAITIVMVATNDYHHLYYKSIQLVHGAPFLTVDFEIGHWYIVHGIYTFSSMLAAFVLLARRWSMTIKSFRKQLVTLMIGQLLPIAAAFVYLIGLVPYGMDPVPLVLCVTSVLYIWAIVSSRMLTIVPIARAAIFESMSEGVVVLDAAGRLVDMNNAMSRMLPGLGMSDIGSDWGTLWHRITGTSFPATSEDGRLQAEVDWQAHGTAAHYDIRSSVVRGPEGGSLGSVLMVIDVTQERKLQQQLTKLAYYDGLTGIYNRTQFVVQAKRQMEQARVNECPLSYILFDIDHFKRINDTYGHEAGDRALMHITAIVQARLPEPAIFGRFGGEEFAIGLPGCSLPDASELAERIRASLEAEPLRFGRDEIRITSSFGMAECRPDDAFETVFRQADQALYDAKRAGRNRIATYNATEA